MKKKLLNGLATFFLVIGIVGGANAATVFVDDFEDGNAAGWLETFSGSGSTGVELHNSSLMAFAKHSASGSHSLSHDFSYDPTYTLSFDMHATANRTSVTGTPAEAKSGVIVSFLNTFNSQLGSAGLIYATNSSLLGANDSAIDNSQHNYSALMGDYAALAGLGATDPISTISLNFFAYGQTQWTTSSAAVWFDNVKANDTSAVPVPSAVWLLGSGLIGLADMKRRKK
jgi:hypothetical protein